MKRKIVIASLVIMMICESSFALIMFYEIRKKNGVTSVNTGIPSVREVENPFKIEAIKLSNGNYKVKIEIKRYWDVRPVFRINETEIKEGDALTGYGRGDGKDMQIAGDRIFAVELSESDLKRCVIYIHQPGIDSGGIVYLIAPYEFVEK